MGLFYDIRVSTSLIPFLHCPIMLYSWQAVSIQSVPGNEVTILKGHNIGHLKKTCICIRVLFRTVSEKELCNCRGVWIWQLKLSFTHAILCHLGFFMGLNEEWIVQNKSGYSIEIVRSHNGCFRQHTESQDALRQTTRHVLTEVAKCMAVDGGIFEKL
jgi:hypothetical protein